MTGRTRIALTATAAFVGLGTLAWLVGSGSYSETSEPRALHAIPQISVEIVRSAIFLEADAGTAAALSDPRRAGELQAIAVRLLTPRPRSSAAPGTAPLVMSVRTPPPATPQAYPPAEFADAMPASAVAVARVPPPAAAVTGSSTAIAAAHTSVVATSSATAAAAAASAAEFRAASAPSPTPTTQSLDGSLVSPSGGGATDAATDGDSQYACAATAEDTPGPHRYVTARDDSEVAPPIVRVVSILVSTVACMNYVGRGFCRPKVVRNESLDNAAFFWSEDTIRYSWSYIERYHDKLFVSSDEDYVTFLIGVFAHEYGHYLDGVSHRRLSSVFASANGFDGLKPKHKLEVWADFIAGCILGTSGLSERPLNTYMRGLSWSSRSDHPDGKSRVSAIHKGWVHCAETPPPPSRFDELERFFLQIAPVIGNFPLVGLVPADASMFVGSDAQ